MPYISVTSFLAIVLRSVLEGPQGSDHTKDSLQERERSVQEAEELQRQLSEARADTCLVHGSWWLLRCSVPG